MFLDRERNVSVGIRTLLGCSTLLAIGLAIYVTVGSSSSRASAEREGVWLARYLGASDNNYDLAVEMIKRDRPIDPAFLDSWEPMSTEGNGGEAKGVIARRVRPVRSEYLVILSDLNLNWTSRSPEALD